MKMLKKEDLPRWYTLGIDQDSGLPYIEVDLDVLKERAGEPSRFIRDIAYEFYLAITHPYNGDPTGEIHGFGESFTRIGLQDNWVRYRINIPRVMWYSDSSCPECLGTRENGNGLDCLHCDGTGKKLVHDTHSVDAVCCSLWVLLMQLAPVPEKQCTKLNQLLNVEVPVSPEGGRHGHPVYGEYAPCFLGFFRAQPENTGFPWVEDVMRRVHKHLWASPADHGGTLDLTEFGVGGGQLELGCPVLRVPGGVLDNDCEVRPDRFGFPGPEKNAGIGFTCHNMDTSIQQLTAFTGLAALCDVVDGKV